MKIYCLLPVAAAFVLVVSCEKPQSEADKSAQIEKEVQARLAAERQADEQQRLAQQKADLDAREKALAAKETSTSLATATPRTASRTTSSSSSSSSSTSSSIGDSEDTYDTFYRKLEPYGAWRESEEYGYVFQPREAKTRNWRPYTDGRWAYTDAGWTWVSEEPFGWATYHYGRWTRLSGVGWVWVPGDEWAPAWVSWRKGDQNVGWAPLPPQARFDRNKGIHKWADNYYDIDAGEYVFIPNEEIGAENIQRSVIPAERNVAIVTETTNVTNITYSNTSIMNEGPSYDELRGRSRRPLERLKLQREFDVRQDQSEKARISGETLQIMTPRFNARATSAPRTSGARLERTAVERDTSGGDPAQFERARQKMRSEVAPPSDAPAKKFEKPTMPAALPASAIAPAATATATPVTTPVATATPALTPLATATPRPTFAPRATPPPTAAPTITPAVVPDSTPRPHATTAPGSTVASGNEVPPPLTRGDSPDREALKAEQQRKRQEAVQKMMEQKRAPRAIPPTAPTPVVPADNAMSPEAALPPARKAAPPQRPQTVPPPPGDATAPAPEANREAARREKALRMLNKGKPGASPADGEAKPEKPNEP